MKHIVEYNLFESSSDSDIFSSELSKRFPRMKGSIKEHLRYYLKRGWEGKFDVIDTPEGDTHLSVEFPNTDIPELIFHAFKIPQGAKTLFDIEPVDKKLISLLDKDAENLLRIISKVNSGISDQSEKLPTDISGSKLYSDLKGTWAFQRERYANWPDIDSSSKYTPSLLPYMSEILKHVKTAFSARTNATAEEVSIDDIRKLPEYKEAIDFGFTDETTPRIAANGNLKLSHPALKFNNYDWRTGSNLIGSDAFTIYTSGPIRITSAGRPAVIGSAPGYAIKNLQEWGRKIAWVIAYMKKRFVKDVFEISSRNEQERLSTLPVGQFYQELLSMDPDKFFSEVLDKAKPEVRSAILSSGLSIKDYIEKDPDKAAFTLKKYYKDPEIRKEISSLSGKTKEEFEKNIDLTGSLGELGF